MDVTIEDHRTPERDRPGHLAPGDLERTVLAALPDGVGALGALRAPDGAVTDFEWLTANPAAERLFGGTALVGRRLRGDGADGGCAGLFAGLQDCLASGGPVRRVLAAAGGRWRVAASPLADGVCAIIADLGPETAEVPSEARAARLEAERANRAKSEFLAHMSHELRTPLNAVLGFSELLLDETFGPLGSPRYRSYAADIHASGEHLLALIDDLLDLSRIDAGKLDLHEEGIDVAEVARRALSMIGEQAVRRGVALSADLADDLPFLLADARALKQMMLNLLSNAVKFTPEGGQAALTARAMPDGGIGLMVADTGVGIAEDDMARVLEPFGRGDIAIAREAEGTGLGLPIVKRLVELHGGRLDLASEPGVGTTAVLIFPAGRSIPRAAGPSFPPTLPPRRPADRRPMDRNPMDRNRG